MTSASLDPDIADMLSEVHADLGELVTLHTPSGFTKVMATVEIFPVVPSDDEIPDTDGRLRISATDYLKLEGPTKAVTFKDKVYHINGDPVNSHGILLCSIRLDRKEIQRSNLFDLNDRQADYVNDT